MPNTDCAVILQKKEDYMNRHILYIIIYNYILVSPGLLRASISLFLFSILVS